jgi:Asp-tRNA(Asn)/Glu-tRNA(Gln) amidotransferase A subunit family amidase
MSRVFELFDPDHPAPVAKSISECRFGFVATDIFDTASGDVKAIWTRAQDLLKAAGAQVETVDLGKEFEGVAGHQGKVGKISTAEGRVNFLREYRVDKDNLDPALHGWVKNDIGLSRKEVTRLQDDVAALRPRIDEIAGQYDALVTPSVIGEALAGIENTGSPQFCAMWTGLHVPVINIPGFAGSTGMPIGLTLVAPR